MPVLVALADDFTGASDQAGMLAEAGVASLLVLDEGFPVGAEWEAVTLATRLRSAPVAEAQAEARRLLRLAQTLRPHMIQHKYCSTFDSTPEGNIGPILDVALEALELPGALLVPALPVNGRTTYLGTHFVHGVPLNESPMRDHPLNPMTDANLVRWLGRQTRRAVCSLTYDILALRPREIRRRLEQAWAEGCAYVIADCLGAGHVRKLAQAVHDLPFISGSSALPMELPRVWRREGWLGPAHPRPPLLARPARAPVLALAGSCAQQTLRQIMAAQAAGVPVLQVHLRDLIQADPRQLAECLLPRVADALRDSDEVLVATSQQPEARAQSLALAREAGLQPRELGLRIEQTLGEVARLARDELSIRHFICAGGETSGAICQALQLPAVEMIRQLAPGVPLCRVLPDRDLVVVLKGGNFGTDDFFTRSAGLARRVRLDA